MNSDFPAGQDNTRQTKQEIGWAALSLLTATKAKLLPHTSSTQLSESSHCGGPPAADNPSWAPP